ncbi:MAG TPA: dihydroneopterin aldolase [Gemmatimonadaceae bacterium]|nr:dihydroneopterin aldolase [Gemmatimonadaceae bacterium]
MPSLHEVTLKSMTFHTRIGALPHEAEIAQSIEVDLTVWIARPEGSRGAEGIVDYRELYDLVSKVIADGHTHYLENLVERMIDAILKIDLVKRARVSVRKPHVALHGPLAFAQVSLERGDE